MLELRPSCEHCNRPLPPAAIDAMICSYECTFCRDCVENILGNVCPNCGGGFCARPIRPREDRRGGNFLGSDPASTTVRHRPLDISAHRRFAQSLAGLAAENR